LPGINFRRGPVDGIAAASGRFVARFAGDLVLSGTGWMPPPCRPAAPADRLEGVVPALSLFNQLLTIATYAETTVSQYLAFGA